MIAVPLRDEYRLALSLEEIGPIMKFQPPFGINSYSHDGSKGVVLRIFLAFVLFALSGCSENDQKTVNQKPAEEVLASVQTDTNNFSLVSVGNPWSNDCDLLLFADSQHGKVSISLKQTNGMCSLFGQIKLVIAKGKNKRSDVVIVQAARGGDGDHTGPILDIYELKNGSFKKLGEQELFDADFHSDDKTISTITGKVLFDFCDVCDGPDLDVAGGNIFVPVKITFGCNGICIIPDISKREQRGLVSRFQMTKVSKLKEEDNDRDYPNYVQHLEQSFNKLLGKIN